MLRTETKYKATQFAMAAAAREKTADKPVQQMKTNWPTQRQNRNENNNRTGSVKKKLIDKMPLSSNCLQIANEPPGNWQQSLQLIVLCRNMWNLIDYANEMANMLFSEAHLTPFW